MKLHNIVLSMALTFSGGSVIAQSNLVLDQANMTGEYKASQSITLADGFSAGASFHAYISSVPNCVAVASAPSGSQNFVMTITPRAPFVDASSLGSKNVCEVMQSIQYFDGLGRPVQTIQVKGSAGADKDVVVPVAYDVFGREALKYLPYASSSNDGSYKASALTDVISYYGAQPAGQSSAFSTPFSRTVFEASPLNRVIEQGAPGDPWQPVPNSTTGHTQKIEYGINGTTEVRLWAVTSTGADGSSYYEPGTLYKTITKDENWVSGNAGTVEEFKDLNGRVILKKVWETASTSLFTYYVYDDLDNLRYVVPPGFSASSFAEGGTDFNNFIYAYHYDGRKRLTEKKIPGKGWEYLVYNKLDQVVLDQDANQRAAGKWMFSKYDALGRVVVTGLHSSTSDRAAWQTAIDAQIVLWESRDDLNSSGTGTGYTNVTQPMSGIDNYLNINYYDDYTFYGNSFGIPSIGQSGSVRSLLTGSRVNVLGSSTMLLTTNYYDNKGQVLQSKSENHLTGTDVTDLAYNFSGQLISSTRNHTVGGLSTMIYLSYEYDHMGRKTSTKEKIGNSGSTEVLLSDLAYTETGQLKDKLRNNSNNLNSFSYNERGWLSSSTAPGFNLQLKYNDGTSAQFNGNISGQLWNTNGGATKTFTYGYDALNRLSSGVSTDGHQEQGISYDAMGNIMSLTRDGNPAQAYSYTGNQLMGVTGGASRAYTYDDNGNALSDGTNTFTYNVLNLPATVSGPNASGYTYDASGKKLTRTSASGTTQYVDGIQYNGTTIDLIQTEEGLARRNTDTEYLYQYNLTDHLGNNRYTFDSNGGILQYDDYYPFGLSYNSFVSGTRNNYLYNGKELQPGLEQYDYGARFYDPVIGRFNTIDRFAEKYSSMTPYQYGALNPISNIDINGDSVWVTHNTGFLGLGKKETLRYDGGSLYNKDGSAYGGKVKGFLKDAVGSLNTLASGDEGGKDLREMENSTVNTTIVRSSDGNSYLPDANGNGGTVNFDPSSGQGGLDTRGSRDRPAYIGLGHELLGHGLDNQRGTLNTSMIPGAGIPYAEQFSTHIENMLRAEHMLPLRQFYGVDATGAGTYPLINGAGQSLFYNNYDYRSTNGLRAVPIRLIVPANTLSPTIIKPLKLRP